MSDASGLARVTHLAPPAPPPWVQGTLALDWPRSPLPSPADGSLAPPPASEDEELRAWAGRYAAAVVEALAGQRPVTQLVRWTNAPVYRALERRVRLLHQALGPAQRSTGPRGGATAQHRPQVRSVHLCRLREDVAEVSVHVRHGVRSRALALRLQRRHGRWLCTALESA